MAKWRASADSSDVTFEQLETAFETTIGSVGHDNDEHIQHMPHNTPTNDLTRHRTARALSHSQRTRTHHSSANSYYCHLHQTHHQYNHTNHLIHSNQTNHNHIHCNRSNSHSNQCNQELVANEELDSQSYHPSHGLQPQVNYSLDQTEFERIWRQLESNKDRYHFLQSLYRSSGNLVFSEISLGSLGDIASALQELDDSVDDFVFVVYILHSLSRAKRFLLSLQFLTLDERIECKKLFVKLWKNMNDIRQDLAENDITELTINALMKTYECDID